LPLSPRASSVLNMLAPSRCWNMWTKCLSSSASSRRSSPRCVPCWAAHALQRGPSDNAYACATSARWPPPAGSGACVVCLAPSRRLACASQVAGAVI
jgi:hypothetical protein